MALVAQWTVFAEIIPGNPMPEYTRIWEYTSEDLQKDEAMEKGVTLFEMRKLEATAYAMALQDPSQVNIVRFQFMWL